MSHGRICPIFAPVIRQVKSGYGRFFVYRDPVPFLKLKFGECLAVQPINIVYKMEGNAYVFYHPQYGGLRVVNNDEGLFFCIEDLVAITDIGRDNLPEMQLAECAI